ncbi:MAG TPA: FAD-dependent oxidoreductase [Polyangiaceae bacterium]|nr:FAD-dependent oxidoreductase [Polyangiaceae bacterium]
MERTSHPFDVDVLVVGSGGAGLVAALAAYAAGARVALIEKADTIGGATAVSGGVIWAPNNHHMAAAGIPDSRDEAIEYITRLSDGRSERQTIEAFVDAAPAVVRFIEKAAPIAFKALPRYADYYAEFPGGKPGGRSLDPGLFDTRQLGPWKDRLRQSPVFKVAAMSVTEFFAWEVAVGPKNIPFELLGQRIADGMVGYGAALTGALLKALLDRGIRPVLKTPARELLVEDGRVAGVRAVSGGEEVVIRARRGVILASGGFEWSPELCAQFLGGVLTHPLSPPSNRGDGLNMLMSAGAALGNMSEAWWCPTVAVPGEEYGGAPFYRGEFTMRSLPHSMIVNRRGERFVNEAHNYNDLMKAFFRFEPRTYERANLPAWLVFDATYVEKYPLPFAMPGAPLPDWIPRAETLAELAAQLGINPGGLVATAARFNGFAAEGVDRDFHRGGSRYDGVYGDPQSRPSPNLGPIERGPFYALQIHPGALGTKGGARVDSNARVLRPTGEPIPGLYAAGNVMAAFSGAGYPGAGATIAGALTFGFIAGQHAAKRDGREGAAPREQAPGAPGGRAQ